MKLLHSLPPSHGSHHDNYPKPGSFGDGYFLPSYGRRGGRRKFFLPYIYYIFSVLTCTNMHTPTTESLSLWNFAQPSKKRYFKPPFQASILSLHFKPPFQASISSLHFKPPFQASISSLHFKPPFQASISSLHFKPPFQASISSLHFKPPFHLEKAFRFLDIECCY